MRIRGLLGIGLFLSFVGAGIARGSLLGTAYDTAATNAANRLVSTQITSGAQTGNWSGADSTYTGVMISGLTDAYGIYGNPSYRTAAISGANYLTNTYTSFQGDEAYGLTQVSGLTANPNSNTYRTAVSTFYSNVATSGTSTYINSLVNFFQTNYSDSEAVIELAYHTMATNYVNATDKTTWRNSLISELGNVDDNDLIPVGSLGLAVWALAQTGSGLDNTTITGSSSVLNGLTLAQLPGELAAQVIATGPTAGAVWYDYAHTDDNGYTEDLAEAIMGLQAAYNNGYSVDPSLMTNGRQVLAGAVQLDGETHFDVNQVFGPPDYPNYAFQSGRLLEAIPEPNSALLLAGVVGLMGVGRRRRTMAQVA